MIALESLPLSQEIGDAEQNQTAVDADVSIVNTRVR